MHNILLYIRCTLVCIILCSCSCDNTISNSILLRLLSLGDLTEIHNIPGSNYSLNYYPDIELATLERNPPINESHSWEFSNVFQVYYNNDYIIGHQSRKQGDNLYFIIHLRSLPDGGDHQMVFNREEAYISAKDSLQLSEETMKIIRLTCKLPWELIRR